MIAVWLHGSFLEETFFRGIDVGILVRGLIPTAYWDFEWKVIERIMQEVSPPCEVDLRVINEAPLSFRFHVIRGRLISTRDEELATDYIESVGREYLDLAPLRYRAMLESWS
ncbi:MAG: hypothetical protein HQK58_06080 [Deltaproteobacteria bacterium]|nr:hypothetical protein [Deltaproteobacteria bacterium]